MDEVLHALADPTRREILLMLRRAPLPAGRIAAAFDVSRPAVSRHLRVLREAGLVCDSVAGRERVYRVDLVPLAVVDRLLAGLRAAPGAESAAWERRFMALETEVHRVRARRRVQGEVKGANVARNRSRRTA